MKTLKSNRTKRIALTAMGIMAVIITMIFLVNPHAGFAALAIGPVMVGTMTLEGKDAELYTALTGAIQTEFEKRDKNYISEIGFKEKVAQLIKESKLDLKDNEVIKELDTRLKEMGLKMTKISETGRPGEPIKSLGQQFKEYFVNNPEEMKKLTGGSVKELKIEFKVAENMLVSTTQSGTVPQAYREPGLTDVARERRFIMDVIGYGPTQNKTIEFVQKVNPDGTVAFVLDTEAFAQIDFDIEVDTSTAKDVGGYITVHENMLADIDFMAGEIDKELVYQVKKAADQEILSGTGLTSHLEGLTAYATAGFSLTTIKVRKPNVGDVISAMLRQVELVGFDFADTIIMNPADYEALIGTKDDQMRYVGHPLLSTDGTRFAGIPISRTSFITAGYILVLNSMKCNIKVLQNIELAIGYNLTGEFTKRLITVRGGMRLHSYVKSNDVNSLVYAAISDVEAAIIQI